MEKTNRYGFSTRAIHAGQQPAPENGAIMTPIYQSTTFAQSSPGEYRGYDYGRTGNPTRTALEKNIASLEGASEGVAFASGCAAADAVMHLLESGDHVLCADDVYGGTYRLFRNVFEKLGLAFSFLDLRDFSAVESALTDKTKLIWVETPSNPQLKVIDIGRIVEIAHKRGVLVVVDNTFASPYLQNPLSLGADMVVHSSTKYLGGHSDVIGGIVVTSQADLGERLHYVQNAVGAVPSPHDCFLLLRSTKTLSVRMERHSENAFEIAKFLESRSDISRVSYPFLESHPESEIAKRQMRLGGGMVTIDVDGGIERARKFLERVEIFTLAESLGGVESLIEHPAIMTHASVPADVRKQVGITDGLVRLSVGIEDCQDLRADLEQALDSSLN